jgi:hypothetical protein
VKFTNTDSTFLHSWGQELSGSKARTDYVAEQSASEAPSASSADEQAECAIGEQRPLSAKDRLALGTNLITYFKATSLKADEISQAGLILVAVLSGGDYDVQGLPRCGAKVRGQPEVVVFTLSHPLDLSSSLDINGIGKSWIWRFLDRWTEEALQTTSAI